MRGIVSPVSTRRIPSGHGRSALYRSRLISPPQGRPGFGRPCGRYRETSSSCRPAPRLCPIPHSATALADPRQILLLHHQASLCAPLHDFPLPAPSEQNVSFLTIPWQLATCPRLVSSVQRSPL